ncbi:hypothetical protein COU78_04310 [Candidatus Peregrinibacteria bacterium CG10_big_fil_rev_8_21_14_0_10_49_24]|nr:MAG: hypothetical protein COV83_00845 [Candidatus Peregrinibacteria bacterium CG11_big_fil_rev_8_21_14_0_20_49_14]PIR50890.1 MAG: hypothetical protein COU78_04310 [Candidatus Peregrinibacteria bacterium CG10_big_fil_rev_8_21_14_0_10_49_24]PJA67167.1 MAG: hypothetical protein CO157_06240 [Candidatus Peregrinibacteria bacterium CG_4_9_14_3_um_filter_49_12]
MKRLLCILALTFPALVLARGYSDTHVLRYNDTSKNTNGAVAISTLTDMGILEGNPDGSFRPYAYLNRAEFIKIVMSLVPEDGTNHGRNCFQDFPSDIWYAAPVCRAKALGIVQGNAIPGVPKEAWNFVAERNVNFAEGVKILVELYDLPVLPQRAGEGWFVRYFEASLPILGADAYFDLLNEDITSVENAGWPLTRWEMSRLVVNFLAYDAGELADYWQAEDGIQPVDESSSSSDTPAESASSSSSEPVADSSSAAPLYTYDSDSDVSQYSNFLRLGTPASQVLAAVSVFSDSEPLVLNTITVTLNTSASSIDSLLVYDEQKRFLGRAYLNGGAQYRLQLKNSDIIIPQRKDYSFYIRASLKPFHAGGVSGEEFRVASVTVEGDGDWSNRSYTKASSDTFPDFQTARSHITSIQNAGAANEPLRAGEDQIIGMYKFTGEKGDGAADLAVTSIDFQLSVVGGVTVTNPTIGVQGISTKHTCSVSSSTVTCSPIPASVGSFEDAPIILVLYGDVSVPADALKAALGVNINQAGSVSSAGSLVWTDGSTSFDWVPFNAPVVRGTYFEQ